MEIYAKQALINSFTGLLNEKPFEKISVTAIVKRAHVSRNTFYYWYCDIYALIDDLLDYETHKIIDDKHDIHSWQEGFVHATRFVSDNRTAVYHIFNSDCRTRLNTYFYDVIFNDMTEAVSHDAEGLSVNPHYIVDIAHFYTSALIGLTNRWLSSDMKEDPYEYIDELGRIFDGNIRLALERASLEL